MHAKRLVSFRIIRKLVMRSRTLSSTSTRCSALSPKRSSYFRKADPQWMLQLVRWCVYSKWATNSSGPSLPLVLLRLRGLISAIISHLKVLRDDLNKIYGKSGFQATIKRPFQSKAILGHIDQHKVYVKEARDKFVVCFHC